MASTGVLPGRVYGGYVAERAAGAELAGDEFVVRTARGYPRLVCSWRLGDVSGSVFEGRDVDITPLRAEPHDGGLVFGYVVDGVVRVEMGARTVEVGAGELLVYDATVPYRLRSDGPHRYLVAAIAPDALHVRSDDRQAVAAQNLSELVAARALAAMLGFLARGEIPRTPGAGDHLGEALVACAHALVEEARGTASRQSALFHELTHWLDEHLRDHDLSADRLAAEHFLSTRYVRKLFSEHGTTVTAYVRAHRLERARDDLLQSWTASLPVAAVAARWGFANPSVFSRLFKRRFGLAPHRYRRDCGART